jgi:hypothetical protein
MAPQPFSCIQVKSFGLLLLLLLLLLLRTTAAASAASAASAVAGEAVLPWLCTA